MPDNRRPTFRLGLMALVFVGAAVAQAPPETEVEFLGGRLGWKDLMLGMSQKQIEGRLGVPIELTSQVSSSGNCGTVATANYDGQLVKMQLRRVHRGYELVSLFIQFPDERPLEPIVRVLKSRIPELTYHPSRHDPDLPESENTKPLYVLEPDDDQAVMIGPKEGLWITHLDCLD